LNTGLQFRLSNKTPLLVSIFFAMVLVVMRLPQWAEVWRPDWIALVVIGWAVFAPGVCGPVFGMLTGLVVDVVLAESFGVHALVYALLAYIANVLNFQMRMYTLFQQAVMVFGLTFIARSLLGLLLGIDKEIFIDFGYWAPLITNMLVWPWIYFSLRGTKLAMTASLFEP
jgi:rod shape-determining protein MreD